MPLGSDISTEGGFHPRQTTPQNGCPLSQRLSPRRLALATPPGWRVVARWWPWYIDPPGGPPSRGRTLPFRRRRVIPRDFRAHVDRCPQARRPKAPASVGRRHVPTWGVRSTEPFPEGGTEGPTKKGPKTGVVGCMGSRDACHGVHGNSWQRGPVGIPSTKENLLPSGGPGPDIGIASRRILFLGV